MVSWERPVVVIAALCVALGGCLFYLNPQCTDGITNGSETDIDCGGSCKPCTLNHSCRVGSDCFNGNCVGGTCAPLPCENGVKDGAETDVDCGGPVCRKCAGQRTCGVGTDCFSGSCDQGTCSSLRTVSFAAPVSYPSGIKTYTLIQGDFNRDGIVDIAAANEEGSSITMFLGKGDGTFTTVTPSFPTDQYPTGMAIADFNHDSIPDLATANYHGNSVSVLFGVGDGTFGPVQNYPTVPGGQTQKIALGDLNGDGNLDAIAVNLVGSATQFTGQPDGTLVLSSTFPVGGPGALPVGLAIADLNGDGRDDVVFVGQALVVRLGNGDGTFGPEVRYPGGIGDLLVVDIDGDGRLDLINVEGSTDTLFVELGRGDGTFLDPIISTTGAGNGAFTLAAADFNEDGVLDLVSANFTGPNASVMLGIGDGRFEPPISGGDTGALSYGVVAADFNGDGKPDFAICNAGSNDVKVVLNTSH